MKKKEISKRVEKEDTPRLFRKTTLLPLLTIVLFTLLVYSGALWNGFVYDDEAQVLENFWIRDIRFLPKLFLTDVWKFYGEGVSNYYRPVMHIGYMINYHIFGLAAWGFHLVNILAHAAVSVMVFFIASMLLSKPYANFSGPPSADGTGEGIFSPPLVAALLFAAHPINAEAVTWIAGLPELSFTFFYLLSLYLYIKGTADGSSSMKILLLSSLSFFVSALSKETALTLPIVLLAYDSVSQKEPVRFAARLKRYFPYMTAMGLYFGMRLNALETFAPFHRHAELNTYQTMINVFPLFSRYLEKLLLPVNLSAYYVLHPIETLLSAQGIFSFGVTAAFIGIAYLESRKSRAAFFSLILIAVPLLPVLYIPALGENSFTERYLYLPSAGFSILISIGGMKAVTRLGRHWLVASIFFLMLGLYSLGTILRIPVWKDNYSLWADTLTKAADGAIPHTLMGDAFLAVGQNNKALEQYKIALQLKPDYADAHTNIGAAYRNLGLMDQAVRELQTAIKLKPSSATAHASLGVIYNDIGMTNNALEELRSSLKLNPFLPGAYVSLGDVYSNKGMIDEAIRQYREGLRINPDFPDAYNNLGIAYARKGFFAAALEQFEAAMKLRPGDPTYHYNAAKAYKALGRKDKADEQIRAADRLKGGNP